MLELVIAAMCVVESHNNPHAIGDGGASHGVLQIGQDAIDDVNRFYGTAFVLSDAYSPDKAKEICVKYLEMWCGKDATPENYVRTWNGGPRWMRKNEAIKLRTLAHWKKVKEALEKGEGSNGGNMLEIIGLISFGLALGCVAVLGYAHYRVKRGF